MTPDPSPAPGGYPETVGPPPAPVWTDGEPANLTAAAADALEWLKTLRQWQAVERVARTAGYPEIAPEATRRLAGCIAALERHLPAPPEGEGRSDA